MSVRIRVDDREVVAEADAPLVPALAAAGIHIPAACYHPDLTVEASCRLCLVEVEGGNHDVPACTLKVTEGLVLKTATSRLNALRQRQLALLAARFPEDYARDTVFAGWLDAYGVVPPGSDPVLPRDADPHPSIRVDMNECILCTRCVRACAEVQGRFVWGVADRAEATHVVAGVGGSMLEARCESCGACVDHCPTGALADRAERPPGKWVNAVQTTCPYCGVGCNFTLKVYGSDDPGGAAGVAVEPSAAAPVNGSHLCVKGRYGLDFVNHPDRLVNARVRRYLVEGGAAATRATRVDRGDWVTVGFDEALAIVAERMAGILDARGPDACAVMSSAKCSNEENYLMQKFARQVLGTHNVDHCARLCHSSTVAGLKAALGSGAMTNTMADIAGEAAALFVIGSNTTEQHPVFGSRLRDAAHRRGVPLIVADPREIELTEFAVLHLKHRPGTDIALVNGLMHLILAAGDEDRAFIDARTEGFEAVERAVAAYSPAVVSGITGVPERALEEAAAILGRHRPAAVIWAMGITQHICGVDNVLALANLQMMLGNLGVPGGGVNPLRGQNNVQGACDMGCLPNVFPGYQGVADAAACEKFAAAWALDGRPVKFSARPGATVTEMIDRAGTGEVGCLYILGENALMSDPNLNHVRAAMAQAEFVVLQEIFPSETAEFADVLLPGASFAEKEGTYTNTERRIQRIRTAMPPPGDARPDWRITADLARAVLAARGATPSGPAAGWDYKDAAAVMDEIAALTPSYAGVSHARLDTGAALHWPVTGPDHAGTPILHVDRFTHGKGIFHAVAHVAPAELPDDDYPFVLTTGRVIYHWHGAAMTRRAAVLQTLCPESEIEVSPHDARALGIAPGDPVSVTSRRGTTRARAWVTERVSPGLVFGNFHFPDAANINNVTTDALDPQAKIPEYKVCAVSLSRDGPAGSV